MIQVSESLHKGISTLEPRIKIVSIAIFCFSVSFIKEILPVCIAILFICLFIMISGIPVKKLAWGYSIASIFIFFASVSIFFSSLFSEMSIPNALCIALVLFLRASCCVLAVILLVESTQEEHLMNGLRRLGLPDLMVKMLFLTGRYIHVLSEERERMMLARRARLYSDGRSLKDKLAMDTISATAGMLLVRAYKRGERIYDAMLARGYDGNISDIGLLPKNYILNTGFAFSFIFISAILFFMQFVYAIH